MKVKIKCYLVTFLFSLIAILSISQNKIWWLESAKISKVDSVFYSISPDSYSMSMAKDSGKWNNKVGAEIGLFGLSSPKVNASFLIGGFINIHDFSKKQFLSWQLWRGNIGLTAFFEWKPLSSSISKSSRLNLEVAYIHESQHATDVIGYTFAFTKMSPYNFPNGSIRSFEFYKAQINYHIQSRSKNWLGSLSLGYKYFPRPVLQAADKGILLNAYLVEAGVQRKIIKKTFLSFKIYYESIQNNFVASKMQYKGKWNKEPFQYRIAEIGIISYGKHYQSISLFANFSYSNGRGLDFPMINKGFGGGFRIFF